MGLPGDAEGVLATILGLVLLAILVVVMTWLITQISDTITEAIRRHRLHAKQEEEEGQFNEDSPLWPGV